MYNLAHKERVIQGVNVLHRVNVIDRLTTHNTRMMMRSNNRPPTMARAIFQISTPLVLGDNLSAFT